jgi:hypothetical protein
LRYGGPARHEENHPGPVGVMPLLYLPDGAGLLVQSWQLLPGFWKYPMAR